MYVFIFYLYQCNNVLVQNVSKLFIIHFFITIFESDRIETSIKIKIFAGLLSLIVLNFFFIIPKQNSIGFN